MLNSGPSRDKKRDSFRLNTFYPYLDTCYTFNQDINKDTIHAIWKVVRGLKSHSNGSVSRTNQKGNYSGPPGLIETWFCPNGMGYILSLNKVYKLFVITYNKKEKTFVVQTKG